MFRSDLVLKAHVDHPECWILVEPLIWQEGNVSIVVPAGRETDLASIPLIFRSILRQNGRSRRPAVLHDDGYTSQRLSRADTDDLFYRALISEGMHPAIARTYWLGVRAGGWLAWRRHAKNS